MLISWGFKAWFGLTMISYAFDHPIHGKDGMYFASTFRQRVRLRACPPFPAILLLTSPN